MPMYVTCVPNMWDSCNMFISLARVPNMCVALCLLLSEFSYDHCRSRSPQASAACFARAQHSHSASRASHRCEHFFA